MAGEDLEAEDGDEIDEEGLDEDELAALK